MRSYPVKEHPSGSAVSEILRYRQKDKQTDILLLHYKDCYFKIKLLADLEKHLLKASTFYTLQSLKQMNFWLNFVQFYNVFFD